MQIVATFVLFAVYALFYAFSEGAEKAFVADLVPEDKRGTAFGLFNFSIGLGALPASIIFGFLYSYFDKVIPGYGGTVAFGFGGLIAIISMVLLAIKIKEPSRGSSIIICCSFSYPFLPNLLSLLLSLDFLSGLSLLLFSGLLSAHLEGLFSEIFTSGPVSFFLGNFYCNPSVVKGCIIQVLQ